MEINVHLEAFEGPLDLLLHLIDKNKINIYDILALIILFLIKNKISEKKFINIKQRIFTWFIIIILFYLATMNRIYLLLLFGLISTLAFKEFLQFAYIKYNKQDVKGQTIKV